MKIAFIDHYDSFSFNVIDWLLFEGGVDGIEIDHIYCNEFDKIVGITDEVCPLVLSPGPNSPWESQNSVWLVKNLIGKVPILGICLGHQIIGYSQGAKILESSVQEHGGIRKVEVTWNNGFFSNSPEGFSVTSYNSLVIDPKSLDKRFKVSAICEFGDIQAIEFWPEKGFPSVGIQYHPESFQSYSHKEFRKRWFDEVRKYLLD